MKEQKKALAICLFFLLFFTLMPLDWVAIADFDFHFEKARGNCNGDISCNTYFPLLHFLGSFFSFNKPAFVFFLNFLLVFATPMAFFFVTRRAITVWLYFAATQYVYLMNGGGAYPQVLSIIFWVGLFATKNNYLRLLFFGLGYLAHSQGAILIGLTWLLLSIKEGFFSKAMPACSAVFDKTPQILEEKVGGSLLTKSGLNVIYVPIKDFVNFFVRGFPLPFFVMGLWQALKERDWVPIVLTGVFAYFSLISGASISAGRVLVLIGLVFLPSLTRFYEGLSPSWKKAFLGLSLITFAGEFGTWIAYKISCL